MPKDHDNRLPLVEIGLALLGAVALAALIVRRKDESEDQPDEGYRFIPAHHKFLT